MMAATDALGAVVRRLIDAENMIQPVLSDPELATALDASELYQLEMLQGRLDILKRLVHARLVKLQGG